LHHYAGTTLTQNTVSARKAGLNGSRPAFECGLQAVGLGVIRIQKGGFRLRHHRRLLR
jgi:hypothetical protein